MKNVKSGIKPPAATQYPIDIHASISRVMPESLKNGPGSGCHQWNKGLTVDHPKKGRMAIYLIDSPFCIIDKAGAVNRKSASLQIMRSQAKRAGQPIRLQEPALPIFLPAQHPG